MGLSASHIKLVCGLLLASALPCGVQAAAPTVRKDRFETKTAAVTRLTLDDGAGPQVRYYLSKPAQRAPLVLLIQGSGCVPNFMGVGTPELNSTIPGWMYLANQGRYAVMAVDKPYQSDEPQQGPYGSAIGCAGEFNQHFSYETWLATLKRAVRHALARPDVDARRVLVIGVSEGAQMAASLAQELPEIQNVALVSGGGPTQLFDFAAGIYRADGSDEDKLKRLQELDAAFSAIRADPASTSKFFMGHPYLRWSSFLAQSMTEQLAHSRARVYIASGMQDASVPILSAEVLYAQLRVQGRDVSFRRIPRVGHSLVADDKPVEEKRKDQRSEYDAIMAWFERR
jgi:pimeloyl-ACP methyl ester carboxylesterase